MPVYGGIWDAGNPPQRSGLYFNVSEESSPTDLPPADGVVALIAQASWGPVNQIVNITPAGGVSRIFGTAGTAYFAGTKALEGGASGLMVYRVAGSSHAAAAITLNDASSQGVITLTAKYSGTRGNNFTVTTREDPAASTREQILLYESGSLLETHTFLKADSVAQKITAINATSTYVVATDGGSGTVLAYVTANAMTGGSNGSAPSAVNITTALAAFEARVGDFSVFALDNYTTYASEIQSAVRAWTTRVNNEGGLFMTVIGGAADESVSTAVARSAAADSDVIVNITRDLIFDGTTYSSSLLAPMVAGMIAGRSTNRAISLNPIDNAEISNPPTMTDTETLVRGSVVPFVLSDGAVVRIQRGRTTLTTLTGEKGVTFRSILAVRKIHATLRAMTGVYLEVSQLGLLNNDIGRATILGKFDTALESLVEQGVANPDYSLILDDTYDNTGETLHLRLVARPAPTVEVVLGTWIIPS